MIRLLIADDHSLVREGLKSVVSQHRDMTVVGEAEDGDATVALSERVDADVLLLDVSMPGVGVLELIRRVREIRARLKLLVISVHPEQHYARRVLRAGADGYVPKTLSSTFLPEAIRHVYNGRKYVSPSLAEELAQEISVGDGQRAAHDALSNREYEVLLELGAGKKSEAIAKDLRLSAKTVRTYRSRIVEKMNFRSTAELIYYVLSNNLISKELINNTTDDISATTAMTRKQPALSARRPGRRQ